MAYDTAVQFDRALKKAIRDTGKDPGTGYRQALRDRFLCRIFSDGGGKFVLKGGSGLLARIPDARKTKDLGDFCTFELTKVDESLDDNGYSRLLRLRYATWVGQEEKDPVLIDLSLDCEATLPPDRITPANRIEVEGLQTYDYLVYALPDQLADKLCAIMEKQRGGWPSSRMKDLVDVVTYVTRDTFSLRQLAHAIRCECSRRSMNAPEKFAAPEEWKPRFMAFAKMNGLKSPYATFEGASSLASRFFDPALANQIAGETQWNPFELKWS